MRKFKLNTMDKLQKGLYVPGLSKVKREQKQLIIITQKNGTELIFK